MDPGARSTPPNPPRPRRSAGRAALRLVGPALLVLVIVRLPDRGRVLSTLLSAAPAPLLLAVALNAASVHLKVLRWDALLRARGIHYPARRAWGAFMSSLYIGLLTPGRLGDALRVHYLRRDADVPYAEGLASVVMDRFCDLYVLVAFAAVGVVRFGSAITGDLAYATWGGIAATVLLPLTLLLPGVAESLMRLVFHRSGATGDPEAMMRFLEALRAQVGKSLWITLPLTVAAFLVSFGQGWLLSRAMGLNLAYFDVMCLLAIATLVGLLPITISGVGVRELLFSLVFPQLGHSAEAGVSFGLLVFVVIYLALAAAGFVSWQLAPPFAREASPPEHPTGPD